MVVRLLRSRVYQTLALLALLMTFIVRDETFRETIRYSIQGIALMPLLQRCFATIRGAWLGGCCQVGRWFWSGE